MNCSGPQGTQTFGPHLGVASALSSSPLDAAFPFCLSFPSGPLKGSSSTPLDPWRSLRGLRHLLAGPLGDALMCYFSFSG